MSRFPNFFAPSGAGDRLLANATTATVELHRWPNEPDDGPAESVASFELKGSVSLTNDDAAELLIALVEEFRRPRCGGKGGVA